MFSSKLVSVILSSIGCLLIGTTLPSSAQTSVLKDGNYLYGEVAKPYQLGKDYLILKVQHGQVTGAVYRPNADYYCFTGKVRGQELELSFVDLESGKIYQQEIGITNLNGPIASQKLPETRPTLNGFFPLDKLAEVDYQILNACLENFRK
jgi:hypothetical protein